MDKGIGYGDSSFDIWDWGVTGGKKMPLSKARMRERKRQERAGVKPASNLNPVQAVKPKVVELQKMIREIETRKSLQTSPEFIPWYNQATCKQGDRVRMRDAAGKVVVVTVPERDVEGNPI